MDCTSFCETAATAFARNCLGMLAITSNSFTAGKVVISLVADVENMMLLTFVKAHTTKSPVTALFVCLEF